MLTQNMFLTRTRKSFLFFFFSKRMPLTSFPSITRRPPPSIRVDALFHTSIPVGWMQDVLSWPDLSIAPGPVGILICLMFQKLVFRFFLLEKKIFF